MEIWRLEDPEIGDFINLEIRRSEDLEIRRYGGWRFGHLEIGVLEIWIFGNLKTEDWRFGE